MKNLRLIILTSLSVLLSSVSVVWADNTHLLGTSSLSFQEKDVDTIRVNGGCPPVPYKSIQLRVKLGDADIETLVVKYDNGSIENFKVRENIPQGGKSRWLDLKGNRRCINQIGVIGDTDDNSNRKARIEFWGKN